MASEALTRVCPTCGRYFTGPVCPACGWEQTLMLSAVKLPAPPPKPRSVPERQERPLPRQERVRSPRAERFDWSDPDKWRYREMAQNVETALSFGLSFVALFCAILWAADGPPLHTSLALTVLCIAGVTLSLLRLPGIRNKTGRWIARTAYRRAYKKQ